MLNSKFNKKASAESMVEWFSAVNREQKINWHIKHTPWFNLETIEKIVDMETEQVRTKENSLSDIDILYLLSKI